ncbi:MAG TPA: DUF1614 domain-containing protein [Pseudolabrys sp.]|jgi:uncharacterized membrane protein|uniref:DUF1614 domain-containing protein n=1 Tax=Pseudolabrys sp. TaxID=1960880 RepID=UPI002DDD1015|nr:DUF1614 domain-containing protein [Pseudolabrys sp.]HEV2630241.1 DUF1614 domain-containing protein [Pseudolabrys sp.]
MDSSNYQYLPLTPGFFSILVVIFLIMLVLVQLDLLRLAYIRLGISPGMALVLLAASLIGSYFNVPVAQIPGHRVVTPEVIEFFGMQYQVPVLMQRPGTMIAVNIGGAAIPIAMSLYLLVRYELWAKGLVGVAIVATIMHWLATPVPGLGVAVPVIWPVIVTTIVAVVLARDRAAPLAYVAGSLGTLIGADLLNLSNIGALGAPIASIGGAGTFDGIFLTGIAAVLLAGFFGPPARPPGPWTA